MRAVRRAVFRCRFSSDRELAESAGAGRDYAHPSLNSWRRVNGEGERFLRRN